MNNNTNLHSSNWSTFPGRANKQKPSVMLVGTSNIENIEHLRLSFHCNTEKDILYTVEEAKKVTNESVSKPNAIAFHILTNELKSNSSTDCVSRLRKLIQVTKVKNPTSRIVISLAINHSDEQKLNLKVNTVHSLIYERSLEEDCNFYISDNGNLGNNGLVPVKFVADDDYHFTDYRVKVLASNLCKSLEQVLNIEVPRYGPRRSSDKLRWQKRNQNNNRKD